MRAAAAVMAVALVAAAAAPALAQVDEVIRLLRLEAGDAAPLSRGEVVARVHDSEDRTEVHSVAAVRVRASLAAFSACAADPSCFKRNADVVEVGAFGPRPVAEEAARLSLDARHVPLLQKCRVGRCELRLPEEVIAEMRALPWGASAARGAAAQSIRAFLARYAAGYAERGHEALPVFADRRVPVSSAESTRALVERPLPLLDLAPGLRAHVRDPRSRAPGASYQYWYKERFYRKLLLAVHHVVLAPASTPAGQAMVVASQQVVATNYMNSAIEVTAFLPTADGGGILAYESRARTDIRPSGFSWIERVLLRRLLRGRLEDQLGALRGRLEASRPPTTLP